MDLKFDSRTHAAVAFNLAWEQLEAPYDPLKLLAAAHASRYHWAQVEESGDRERSIGLWQCSRAYAVIGEQSMAMRMATACIEASYELEPFFQAYAHEAMARALLLSGDLLAAREQLLAAEALMQKVDNDEERAMLERDITSLNAQFADVQ